VSYWRARSEIILSRALAEGRAGSATADVITTISPQLEALRREGLLQEVHSPYQKEHAEFGHPGASRMGSDAAACVRARYNTNKVSRAELPRQFRDLLAPRWKGGLRSRATTTSGSRP